MHELPDAPYGYDVWTHTEVVPKPAPPTGWRWRIGPVGPKSFQPEPGIPGSSATESEITVQLTADQQVTLTVGAEDAYDNPIDLSGVDITWESSDTSIVAVEVDANDNASCKAVAVGPVGTASVTASGGTDPKYQGSLAIDVVAGQVTEVVITAGNVENKPAPGGATAKGTITAEGRRGE